MPEGHTIHALARDLRADLAGTTVEVRSPQGRFAPAARHLDGRRLDRTEAWGKHLFCWFGADVVHVHLGLVGKFARAAAGADEGAPVRLELVNDRAIWQLRGPQTCALVTPADRDLVVQALGPDPLRRSTASARRRFRARIDTRRGIASVLLDQTVVAGIGNVYRAELLFVLGIHPLTPAHHLLDRSDEVWDTAVSLLRQGLALGRIVTVDPTEVGVSSAAHVGAGDRLYVYKREGEGCRRCATPVAVAPVQGRLTWWCPTCQPDPEDDPT